MAGADYDAITGAEIVLMVRQPQPGIPKADAAWFIPSTYREADARNHQAQRERGSFHWLAADLDQGNPALADVLAALAATVGERTTALVYSTRSATADCRKWRVLVPLATPVAGADYGDTAGAFYDLIESAGLVPDRALARPGQLVYLPNAGAHYESRIVRGAPLALTPAHPIVQRREAAREAWAEGQRAEAAERERRTTLRREAYGERDGSPIEAFNAAHALTDLLIRYGYVQAGGSDDWRSPLQASGSYATRVTGERWISQSGSDAAAGLGRETVSGARAGDAFDLFAHFEHGGDVTAALSAYAAEVGRTPSPVPGSADPGPEPGDPGPQPEEAGPESEGVSIESFFAYRPMHSYIFAPLGDLWPGSSVNAAVPAILVGNKLTPPASWLDKNRYVEQMTWAPGLPMVISDRLVTGGGLTPHPGCSIFNLYRPSALARRRGDPSPWIDHVRRIYPAEHDHLIQWFAWRVQRPEVKINHAIVLGGKQGIGKDTLLEPVKRAVGAHNFSEVSPQQLLGRFNAFLKSVIIRVSEARDLGEVDRFGFYDHMKAITAAPPDVLRVDEKTIREYSILNCCGVIITSNHRTDGIFLPPDDRRHYVAWSDAQVTDFEPGYFDNLYRWIDNGGDAIVSDHLHRVDLSGFDPKAPPPKTPAFWAIVDASRVPEDAELADALDRCGNPPAVTLGQVKALADEGLADFLGDRKNARRIPHRFEVCGYIAVRNPDAADGLWSVSKRRQVIYAQDKLSLRLRLQAASELAK